MFLFPKSAQVVDCTKDDFSGNGPAFEIPHAQLDFDRSKAMANRVARNGTTETEWIRAIVQEARIDPVGLWAVIKTGREQFSLSGADLEQFVRRFVGELIAAGATPIVGDRAAAYGWSPVLRYDNDPLGVANAVVREWLRSAVDPDVDGVWFAFPSVWR